MLDRLHKILARAGVAALRPAEDMILQGRVTVNGRTVRELGARADPATDVIEVDGQRIHIPERSDPHRYLLLNKPVGVISTAHDTHDRRKVVDLVPNDVRVFPVGRLDAESEGLMLLTDDGDLAYRLTHPRFAVDKEYRVLVDRTPQLSELRQWRTRVRLPDGDLTAGAWVEVLERSSDGTWLRVVMQEGRKRQIREVARTLGLRVLRLMRVREGTLTLGDLAPGSWRELTHGEVEALRAHTQHIPSREADEEWERMMSDEETGRPRRLHVVRRPRRDADTTDRGPGSAATEGGMRDAPPEETPSGQDGPERADFRSERPPRMEGGQPARAAGQRGRFDREAEAPEERHGPDRRQGASNYSRDYPPRQPGRGSDQRGEREMEQRGPGRAAPYGRTGAPPTQRGFGRAPAPSGTRRPPARGEGDYGRGRNEPAGRGFERRGPDRGPQRSPAPTRDDRRGFGQRPPARDAPRDSQGRPFAQRGTGPRPESGPRREYSGESSTRGNIRGGVGQGRGTSRGGRWNDRRGPAPAGRRDDDRPEVDGNVREEFGGDRSPRAYGGRSREGSSFGTERGRSGESRGPSGGSRSFSRERNERAPDPNRAGGPRQAPARSGTSGAFGRREGSGRPGGETRGGFGQRPSGARRGPPRRAGSTAGPRPPRPKRRDDD